MKNGAHYLMLNQYDKERPFTHVSKWKFIASGYVFLSSAEATRVYRILLLIKNKNKKNISQRRVPSVFCFNLKYL